jgi:ankyrin repeat protein
MVKLLLEFRKNSQNTMDLDAAQLLTIASEKGYQNLVHLLLQNQISVRNPYCHAIQQSAAKGHVEILKILLKAFGGPGEQVNNALHSASAVGNMECVKLLVEFGAEPACNDHKALKEAFRRRHIEVAQYLLNCYQVNSEVLARIKREAKQVNYYDLAY